MDLSSMDSPFLREEIKRVVFYLSSDKALGPDGFPISFFKKFWNILEKDFLILCSDFYNGSFNLERINWAIIALIPKSPSLEGPADYRPISLITRS